MYSPGTVPWYVRVQVLFGGQARAGAELEQHSQAALVAVQCCQVRWCVLVCILRQILKTPFFLKKKRRVEALNPENPLFF